ncbi:MAG: hypothetical protein KC776_16545 [Myxococcales bacterium]|nr:hypothetical protein [Myxococcales bacterium]MCB9580188.1 hypothetical protein [Polyangiaceae bacterium]
MRSRSIRKHALHDPALDAMDANGLRALICEMVPWFDERLHARFANALVEHAARSGSGWAPEAPGRERVGEILEFAATAERTGYADPAEVDAYLREGSNAFLSKDYAAALEIFRALLIPAGDGDFHMGQDELLEEVLVVEPATCAAQYVVSTYMTSPPEHRAEGVLAAIDEMRGIGDFWDPLREMEDVVVEALPDLDAFLWEWKALVERRAAKGRDAEWEVAEARWLREVVYRTQGIAGLAEMARRSRRAEDLWAWCRALAEAGDWSDALAAYDEAAALVPSQHHARGGFLDGAALAAQQLGRKNLPVLLERAWRAEPSMTRLRRWLGSSTSKKVLIARVAQALAHCPKSEHRQRGLLHFLNGDLTEVAKLLASAPGLGWSHDDHPGHLMFPLFASLLGDDALSLPSVDDDLSVLVAPDAPRLATPDVADLIALAGLPSPTDDANRGTVLKAMRAAAEKRIAGVTENQRRRHYGHAASLALACVRVDPSAEGIRWFERIRSEYRRYPALQRELRGGQR